MPQINVSGELCVKVILYIIDLGHENRIFCASALYKLTTKGKLNRIY